MDYYSVDFYDIDENNFGYSSYGAEIRAEDRLELLSRGFRD
jgi:hypothetical protein